MLTWVTKGGRELKEMLTLADKGRRGGVVWTPLFLGDLSCEQPLPSHSLKIVPPPTPVPPPPTTVYHQHHKQT